MQQQASASAPAATSPQRPPGSSLLCLLSPLAPTAFNHCTKSANKIEVVAHHFDTIHTLLPCAATWASSSAIIPASALAGAAATSFAFAVSPLSDCLPCDSGFKCCDGLGNLPSRYSEALLTFFYSDLHLIFSLKLLDKGRFDLLNKRAWGANSVPCRQYAMKGRRQPGKNQHNIDSKLVKFAWTDVPWAQQVGPPDWLPCLACKVE